jgi:hypothetical protein
MYEITTVYSQCVLRIFNFLSQYLSYFYSPPSPAVVESVLSDGRLNSFLYFTGVTLLGINFKQITTEQNDV